MQNRICAIRSLSWLIRLELMNVIQLGIYGKHSQDSYVVIWGDAKNCIEIHLFIIACKCELPKT